MKSSLTILTEQVSLKATLQTCIREDLSSNLGRYTGYPDFFVLFSVSTGKCREDTSIRTRTLHSKLFSVHDDTSIILQTDVIRSRY
jgi:hypothetical protein